MDHLSASATPMKKVGARENTIASISSGVIFTALSAPIVASCACSAKVLLGSLVRKSDWYVEMTATLIGPSQLLQNRRPHFPVARNHGTNAPRRAARPCAAQHRRGR